jgi:superfamily II DNA or RNA helicase
VIWAQYIPEVLAISKMLSVDPIYGKINPAQRVKICSGFQAGKIEYIVCQPETMKFGTRMDAADTMIYFSTTESSLTRMQTEDRIVDVGKSNGVLIIDLVTADTVDDDIQASLKEKENTQIMMTRLINAAKKRQGLK